VRRGYRPTRSLVVLSSGGHLRTRPLDSGTEAAPGLLVYRFGADLFYANANTFISDVQALSDRAQGGWVCIDGSAISDIDYSGWQSLVQLRETLAQQGTRVVLADVADDVRAQLDRYGFTEAIGADAIFESIGDAIAARRAAT
jgi:MFS superfamily sulfate permease-like transporter